MELLNALLGGAKALIRSTTKAFVAVIGETLREVENTRTERALSTVFESWVQTKVSTLNRAADLAAEEAELAQRMAKDGKLRPQDWDRVREMGKERDDFRKAHADADALRMQEDIEVAGDAAKVVAVDADELASTVGLLVHKVCSCGGRMAVTTRYRSVNGGAHRVEFEWACPTCKRREKFDPEAEAATIVRTPDTDLDLPTHERHRLWNEPKTLAETNIRLSRHLGEPDKDVLCPDHLTPMKLFPNLATGAGAVLGSYAYACAGVTLDGHMCKRKVPLDRMAQASAALRRLEGSGILKNRPTTRRSVYTGDSSV